MIITDMATINRMAEEVASIPISFVNVDAYDIVLLHRYSDYIQAIRMEVTTLEKSTFDVLASFLQAMETEKVSSSIFYLMLNGDQSVDIQSEQIPWIYSFVENNLPEVDVCYGVGKKTGRRRGNHTHAISRIQG